jgi:hypothetical protein
MEFKDAVNTLLSGFQGMIDKAIEAAPFDKTYRGRIVAVDGSKYSVQINGTIHEIKTSKVFSEGEYVNVLVPKNDWNKALISDQGKIEMPEIPEIPEVTLSSLLPANAGAHNSIFRGQNLGSSVTDEQWAEIKAGTFTNLFIGDYWVINGIAWEIAAFDYYLYNHIYSTNVGVPTIRHNVIIVPGTNLYSAQMNTTSTTEGGYTGSAMFTANLEAAKTTINNAFGSAHILSHSVHLVKAVSNGIPSSGAWTDVTVDLMNEQMVYGGSIFGLTNAGTIPYNYRVEKTQLPLFALAPAGIQQREYPHRDFSYWLKDVVSATQFATVGDGGLANYSPASSSLGVRPYFSIYQA